MQRTGIALLILIISGTALGWRYPTEDFCVAETRINYLHDDKSQLTAKQAMEQLRQGDLKRTPQNLHYGYTKGTVWLYLKAKKRTGWQKCALELANPQLDEIHIYHAQPDGSLKLAKELGDSFPFNDRVLRVRNYVFPFRADDNHEFVMALKSTATMTIPVKIQWRDAYINDASRDYLLLGLFYGLMIFFIFFGLHSFISFRSNAYLLYSAFALSMLLFFVDRDGIAYQFLWPHSTEWKLRSVRVFAAISMGLGVLYFTYVLRLRDLAIRVFSYSYAVICALYVVVLLIAHPSLTNHATILLGVLTPLSMVALPLIGLKKKRIFAPYMLIAGCCSLVGFTVYALSVTDHIPANFFTDNAMKFSTLTEFFFLTLGLHKKIKRNHRKQAEYKATYEVSNMLAHDVAKPFEMMRKFLKRTEQLSERELPHYIAKNANLLQESIRAAEEMVLDLKEIGRSDRPLGESKLGQIVSKHCNGRYDKELNYRGTLKIDEFQLDRMIINIVRNAHEATSGFAGAQFWVKSQEDGDYVNLILGNTGSMIPKDIISRVFDFRFTSGKRNGNGIGLSVVERAAAISHGEVWVESNGYSSNGRSFKPTRNEDYVEFHIRLLKGGSYED